MRVLVANLKQLYQCRRLWLVYIVLFALVWRWRPMVRGDGIEWADLFSYFFINWPVGYLVGRQATQILVKPFVYCLPGHRAVPRQIVFLVGLSWSLILFGLVVNHHGLSVMHMAALFSVGLTSYLSGALQATDWDSKEGDLGSDAVIMLFLAGVIWSEISNALIRTVPGVFVIIGLVVSVAAWRHLQCDSRVRVLCNRSLGGDTDFQRSSRQKATRPRQAQSALPAWVETLFMARIDASAFSGVTRYIWGCLYLAFGRVLDAWWVVLFVVFVVTIYSGYEARIADSEQAGLLGLWVSALVLSVLTTFLPLSIRSDLLLPAGRRERFFAALTVAGVATAVVTGVLLFMVTFAGGLHSFAPAWFGHPQGVECILFALALIPTLAIVNLFFYRPLRFRCIVCLGFGMIFVIAQLETHFMTVPLLLVGSVCMWVVFVLLMYRICAKRCLVA